MTENQIAAFEACIGTVSARVSRRIFSLGDIRTPAGVKDFFGFSFGQLASMTGYSRSHVAALVNYGRAFTPACLEAWRDLKRQAVRLALGPVYSIKFKRDSLTGTIMRPCPVCGRLRVIHYKGESSTCQVHTR